MSETQATETVDEIELVEDEGVIESDGAEDAPAESEEDEIVVEGEEQPTSKPVPIGVLKRFNKLNGKIEAKNEEAERLRLEKEMLAEENRLLKLSQSPPDKRPDEDDFDSRAEFLAADQAWQDNRIDQKAAEKVAQALKATQSQENTANQDNVLRGKITNHYERANTLKIKNYETLEDNAIDALGNDFAKQLMANAAKSHLILGHLGANTARAQELAELAKTDPLKAYTEALEIGDKLTVKGKNKPALDPETVVEGGRSNASEKRGPKGATFW
jgi:hypothetical protein